MDQKRDTTFTWTTVKRRVTKGKDDAVAALGALGEPVTICDLIARPTFFNLLSALEKFGRSKYARRQLSTVPTSIIAGLLKSIVNFLLLYRLATGYVVLDFFVSIIVTICLAIVSPIFYYMVKEREQDIIALTNHFADHAMHHGYEYLLMWRGRTIAVSGAVAILFLLCFEVNSWYLIRTIVELLLSFWIVDQINLFRESLFKPVPVNVEMVFCARARPYELTRHDIVSVPLPVARLVYVVPDPFTTLFKKATVLRIASLLEAVKSTLTAGRAQQPTMVIGGSSRIVVSDWYSTK